MSLDQSNLVRFITYEKREDENKHILHISETFVIATRMADILYQGRIWLFWSYMHVAISKSLRMHL